MISLKLKALQLKLRLQLKKLSNEMGRASLFETPPQISYYKYLFIGEVKSELTDCHVGNPCEVVFVYSTPEPFDLFQSYPIKYQPLDNEL